MFSGRIVGISEKWFETTNREWFSKMIPFMLVTGMPAIVVAIALSAVSLFAVGAYSAKTLIGDWRKSGLQMLTIGLGAAAVGFLIGRLFH
jgi:VIT1/CCC1 family predicted Fe2+/Mn2+ transporter